MAGLCEACDVEETTSPGQLLASIAGDGDPIVVVVDALDEAVASSSEKARGQFPVVDRVLAPLVRGAGRTRLRLLLGTRRHLLAGLGEPVRRIDLDAAAYADPSDPGWRNNLPRGAAAAMRDDLDRRLGADAGRARALLLPLAYAQGTGLPWEDVWPLLVRALSGTGCTSTELDWLIDEAGYYIVESTSEDGRRSVYRLYHEALAEHLREGRDDTVADQAAIVDALTGHVPLLDDGHVDWDQAHPYIRTNLSTHAAGTDRLDGLVIDPRFLLAASRSPLLAALPSATAPEARECADAYQRADGRLRACPARERAAYLQLAARCAGADRLADAVRAAGLPLAWATDWASWRLEPPHMTFTGHDGAVNAVAVGELDGRTFIVSASDDATVRIWDAATGTPLGTPLTGHDDWVYAAAIAQLGSRTIVASGGEDKTVRLWDAAAGTSVTELPPHYQRDGLPEKINLAATVRGIVFVAPDQLLVATGLGIASLRLRAVS